MTITEHDPANFRYGDTFGVDRSDRLIYIQITVFNTRNPEQKKALFQRLAELLEQHAELRPQDLWVNIYDRPKDNWSVGNGLQFG